VEEQFPVISICHSRPVVFLFLLSLLYIWSPPDRRSIPLDLLWVSNNHHVSERRLNGKSVTGLMLQRFSPNVKSRWLLCHLSLLSGKLVMDIETWEGRDIVCLNEWLWRGVLSDSHRVVSELRESWTSSSTENRSHSNLEFRVTSFLSLRIGFLSSCVFLFALLVQFSFPPFVPTFSKRHVSPLMFTFFCRAFLYPLFCREHFFRTMP
jgi:hypothetical protein